MNEEFAVEVTLKQIRHEARKDGLYSVIQTQGSIKVSYRMYLLFLILKYR